MVQSQKPVSLVLVAGVASAMGLFSTFEAYNYVAMFTSEHPTFLTLLGLNVSYWWSWAVLVPGIIWLARRYPFGRKTWRHSVAIHILGVLVFTGAHTVLTVSCRVLILSAVGRDTRWVEELQRLFLMNFDWEMMTYWAVVGLSHALDFHRESQDQAVAAAQLETRLAEAQLQALQRQLHPHFLFNTLHAISALMHRDTEAADAMLARLSELLRLTLDRITVQQIPLRDDLEFIDKYLDIERTRFGERLHVRTVVDPEALDAAVPTLMLQPIVENAIRHGIARRVGGGHLEIRARRDADRLILVVQDDGPGLPQARRDALNTGVGLSNTRSRLEHLYRDRYRFDFAESPGGGLTVTIAVPFVAAVENASTMEVVA